MGKSAPTPPPAPDPNTIINATANANQQTATTQAKLNNVNYSGPQGTTSYNYDPGTGQFTQNVTLNPTEQAASDAYQNDQRLAADVGNKALTNVQGTIGQGLTPPSLTGSVNAGGLQTGYNSGGAIDYGYNNGGPIQRSVQNTGVQTGIANPGAIQGQVAPTYSPFGTLGTGGRPAITPYGGPAPMQRSPAPASSTGGGGAIAPYGGSPLMARSPAPASSTGNGAQTVAGAGNAAGVGPGAPATAPGQMTGLQHAQRALTNIDTPGHPAAFQKIEQAGVSAQDIATAIQGNPQAWAAYQQANGTAKVPHDVMALLQQGGGSGGAAGGGAGGTGAPAGGGAPGAPAGGSSGLPANLQAILSNPVAGTQLATYGQATQMLDPQWQQAQEQQQAQLVAQGLSPNSAAFQNSMQLFNNSKNNAYNSAIYSAINAGDTEQNNLYGQNLASANYALGAQNQNYNQLMGQAGLYNSASGQQFTQGLEQGQFANASQLQGNQENQQAAAFNNTAQGQANSQNAAAAGFYNTTQNQNFQQLLANAQLGNSAAQQTFQNQAYAQQQPINEATALMAGSQVAMPPSGPAQNTEVKAPDVTNAYQLQQNGQQFAYNANQKNSQSGLSGLFSLGNAALGLMGI